MIFRDAAEIQQRIGPEANVIKFAPVVKEHSREGSRLRGPPGHQPLPHQRVPDTSSSSTAKLPYYAATPTPRSPAPYDRTEHGNGLSLRKS